MSPLRPIADLHAAIARWGHQAVDAWVAWWTVILTGAKIIVLALTPSSYSKGAHRYAVLRSIYESTAPLMVWLLVLSSLLSQVLIRIVVTTAQSYGLSEFALAVLVRTLVLELIPLYAALFVAVRYAMPAAQNVRRILRHEHQSGVRRHPQDHLRAEMLPRAIGAMFSVLLTAALSCLLALVLTYLNVYGFIPWGLPGYTERVGAIFTPAVSLIFILKTAFFAMAVAFVPMAASAQRDANGGFARRNEISEFARLLSVILMIEVVSLIGNYY
ncbi:ABC transporter permease [Hydrogenophaga sp. 5NK40-0174]|uniref:ABC transporter permease n=1 Tax=Hydrogenophaga sp. 5NK40-0174 TaxID=3127649 RepID=UPI003105E4FC